MQSVAQSTPMVATGLVVLPATVERMAVLVARMRDDGIRYRLLVATGEVAATTRAHHLVRVAIHRVQETQGPYRAGSVLICVEWFPWTTMQS